jgi:hypothetical protein
MRLLDAHLGLMECKVCGRRHFAGRHGDGGLDPASWECQNGCSLGLDHTGVPKIQLLVFRGCPLAEPARRSLRKALAALRIEQYEELDLLDPTTPTELHGWGSPTILIEGRDVVDGLKGDSVRCRSYPAPDRVPSPDVIAARISRALR